MLSRKRISSSESVVSGAGTEACSVASGMARPFDRQDGRLLILALLPSVNWGRRWPVLFCMLPAVPPFGKRAKDGPARQKYATEPPPFSYSGTLEARTLK